MYARIGNPNPIEHTRDAEGRQVTRSLGSEGVTEILFPDGISIDNAVLSVTDALNFHMDRNTKPVWIESDSKPLHKALCRHYGIKMSAKRPGDWGVPRASASEHAEGAE